MSDSGSSSARRLAVSGTPREVLLEVGVEDRGRLVNLLSPENSDADAKGKHGLRREPTDIDGSGSAASATSWSAAR